MLRRLFTKENKENREIFLFVWIFLSVIIGISVLYSGGGAEIASFYGAESVTERFIFIPIASFITCIIVFLIVSFFEKVKLFE